MTITKNERKDIMRQATRSGLTQESIGEWMNLARRFERLGNFVEAATCARKAIDIHETWGSRFPAYAMAEGTLERAQDIVAKGA